jgi:L-malate glycosyltransferase
MHEKINVLHIIKSLGRGGAEMLLPETLRLHDQAKYEFHYIYFLPWKDQMVGAIRENGGVVSCLSAANNIQILLKARAILQYIRKHNIQLVHCHLPWAGVVGRIVYKLSGVPVVYTEHNKQERYHGLTRWMNRLTFNWQTAAIAVSKDVAESIDNNIHPRIPVREILNGVNVDAFQRSHEAGMKLKQQLGVPQDAVVIGTLAVFRFQKRIKEWLEVFATVSSRYPNVVGVIVGDGPLKAEIEQHRKALGLEERVIMPGLQTEVKPWFSAMDIFMMTSQFEGLPIALLEAMSMECAIATTDAGGVKEVVKHEQNGLVVPVENWKELEEQVAFLVNNPVQRKSLAKEGRARVEAAFGMKRMVRELEDLYGRVLNHKLNGQ